jgi:hypothetical protein
VLQRGSFAECAIVNIMHMCMQGWFEHDDRTAGEEECTGNATVNDALWMQS